MAYSRKFTPKNTDKYIGDLTNIVSRSTWEYAAFKWCDINPDVKAWNSEGVVIPYICGTDGRKHRYFVDLYIEFTNGRKILVEIKPSHETVPPKTPKRRTKKYLMETLKYVKNESKWKAAKQVAEDNGMEFYVWTEDTLRSLGIKIL